VLDVLSAVMRRRAAAAFTLSVAALVASSCASGELSSPLGEFEVVALQGFWLEGCLALIALVIASLLPGSAIARLGLAPGRLPARHITVLVIGTLAASASLDALLDLTQWKAGSALGEFEEMLMGIRGRSLLLGIVTFAFMPGFAEELLCRGLMQRSMVVRLGPVAGITIASLIFGALHLDPVHALFATPLGVYLGLVCWLSGGIRASIVCHIANNLVALLAGALLPASNPPALTALVAGATIAAAAMLWVWRGAGAPPPETAPAGYGRADDPQIDNPH
jgi:membrane protease YdiL (CAAX protease family)